MQMQSRGRAMRNGWAIQRISKDWMADGFQVHPQLVGAAREWLQFQATELARRLKQTPTGAAGFTRRIHAIERWPVLAFGDRQLD
jgi:hypothetical protein